MLSLVVAALVIKSLQPLHTLAIEVPDVSVYGYARDDQFEYLATPKGLYRSPRLATSLSARAAHDLGAGETGFTSPKSKRRSNFVSSRMARNAGW